MSLIDKEETKNFSRVLKDANLRKHQRREVTVSKLTQHKIKHDRDNAMMKASSFDFVPLMKGKTQLGKVGNV